MWSDKNCLTDYFEGDFGFIVRVRNMEEVLQFSLGVKYTRSAQESFL